MGCQTSQLHGSVRFNGLIPPDCKSPSLPAQFEFSKVSILHPPLFPTVLNSRDFNFSDSYLAITLEIFLEVMNPFDKLIESRDPPLSEIYKPHKNM